MYGCATQLGIVQHNWEYNWEFINRKGLFFMATSTYVGSVSKSVLLEGNWTLDICFHLKSHEAIIVDKKDYKRVWPSQNGLMNSESKDNPPVRLQIEMPWNGV